MKLADETASSIQAINKLIHDSNEKINAGMSGANQNIELLSSMIDGFSSVQKLMSEINETMKKQLLKRNEVTATSDDVLERSDIIKTAAEEQNFAVNEMVSTIGNINDVSQSTASGALDMADESNRVAALSNKLKEQVDFFKV